MIDTTRMLELANKAALLAGKAILEVYDSGDFGVELKSDRSPLTLADKAAHTVISNCLKDSGLPLLSEEGRSIPYAERKDWEYFWLIDPLDGTKEFIRRTGEFTVNIALMHAGVPVAGVIYAPSIDMLYYGSTGSGAFKQEKERKIPLPFLTRKNTIKDIKDKEQLTIVASKSHMNDDTKAFIDQFANANFTSMGSSLKFMLLAEGAADVYPRIAPTMEWDTAAGHAILRSLNRGVYQVDMQSELQYNKEDLLNPSFIAI